MGCFWFYKAVLLQI